MLTYCSPSKKKKKRKKHVKTVISGETRDAVSVSWAPAAGGGCGPQVVDRVPRFQSLIQEARHPSYPASDKDLSPPGPRIYKKAEWLPCWGCLLPETAWGSILLVHSELDPSPPGGPPGRGRARHQRHRQLSPREPCWSPQGQDSSVCLLPTLGPGFSLKRKQSLQNSLGDES